MGPLFWGFPAHHGGTQNYRWMVFVNGKILDLEMDDDWVYPHDSGNLHISPISLGFPIYVHI